MDRAADSGPCDPSSIPLGEKKENKRKEAGVGPFKKKEDDAISSRLLKSCVTQLLYYNHHITYPKQLGRKIMPAITGEQPEDAARVH